MIPMIQQAISMGYTAVQILKYISSKFKSAAPGIASARQQGYSDEDILKFIGGKIKPNNQKRVDDQLSAQEKYLKASGIKTKEEKEETRNKFISGALGVGASVLGAYNMYKNYGGMLKGLGQTFGHGGTSSQQGSNPPSPGQPTNPAPNAPQSPGQMATPQSPMPGPNIGQQLGQQAASPVQNAMQPATQQEVGQAAQAMPQEQPIANPKEYLQQKGVLGIVDALKDKNTSEQIAAAIGIKSTGKAANIDPELKANIDAYVKTTPQQAQISAPMESTGQQLDVPKEVKGKQEISPKKATIEEAKKLADLWKQEKDRNPNFPHSLSKILQTNLGLAPDQADQLAKGFENIEKPIEQQNKSSEPQKIEKSNSIKSGDDVVTEDGEIAEVKGISGNNFLIEENGKVRQVPMDSLRSQPEAIKKAKIIFDPSKLPEDERSAALAISIPLPDKSAIVNMFHNGEFYIYKRKDGKPIDESIIKRVVEGQDIPITSGETFMGAWNNDKGDSRGSAAYKELTSMAQSAEKMAEEDDPNKPLIFEKITNGFTHAYHKEFIRLLKEAGKQFSAKPKKPKK